MGKGKKRKNPGVGVDFRKVKHKVGKKLPKAQNETRTDFQARSINLPNQSITQDKAGAAVSERNLTLKELLNQLSHHNASTRRDALTGLQQLVSSHPSEARLHAALLLEALAPRVSDGEAPVRAALLTTLRTAVLPALGPTGLSPFLPLLLAHVSAALTHLSADVRLDALAVLQALTEAAPQLLSQPQVLEAVLGHFAGLLSRSHRGRSVKSQALTGLLKVVASLDKFLVTAAAAGAAAGDSGSGGGSSAGNARTAAAAAAAAGGSSDSRMAAGHEGRQQVRLMNSRVALAPPTACQLPSGTDLLQLYCPAAAAAVRTAGGPSSRQQQQQQPANADDGTTAPFSGSNNKGSTANSSNSSSSRQQLCEQVLGLLGVLFDCWSEAAPSTLSTTPEAESAQVLVHILSATQLLLGQLMNSDSTGSAGSTNPGGSTAVLQLEQLRGTLGDSSSDSTCPGFSTRQAHQDLLQRAAGIVLPPLLKAFPAVPPASRGLPVGLTDLLQRFNLTSMQLCAAFMAAGMGSSSTLAVGQLQQQQRRQQQQGGGQQQGGQQQQVGQLEWHQRLLEFMAGVLSSGSCLPQVEQQAAADTTTAKTTQQQQHGSASAAAASNNSSISSSTVMVAVLQSLQQLLPHLQGPHRQHILAAISQLSSAAAGIGAAAPAVAVAAAAMDPLADGSSSSGVALRSLSPAAAAAAGSNAVRSECLQLQLQLLRQYLIAAVPSPLEETHLCTWLAAAPKLLYQLGPSKPKISTLLLQLLFEAARLALPGSPLQQQLLALDTQLSALMGTALQQQQQQGGGAGSNTSPPAAAAPTPVRVVLGPLADLPPHCQQLAFDTLAQLPSLNSPALLRAVALACRVTPYSDAAVQRLLDGLLSGAAATMAPASFLSLVATLMSPGPAGGYVDRASKKQIAGGFGRQQLLVDSCCRWLHVYGPVADLLPLLVTPLLQQWQQLQPQQQQCCCLSYSLVALAALGVGCWAPSSSRFQADAAAAAAAAAATDGPAAAAAVLPAELLLELPGLLARHCVYRSSSSSSSNGGSRSGRSDARVAAEAVVLDQCCQQLVLPLVRSLPSSSLLVPFMQQLVQLGLTEQQQQLQQEQQQQHRSGVLRVVLHVLRVLLGRQELKAAWLQHEGDVQPLLQQLQGEAQRLQQQSGDGSALAAVEQLQNALHMVCKR